ncbi:polysaccharide biosynthesis/export family protein [Microbacter margulisiae]|uniref:Polysaccharide export outer membrane protein n=1 Tax=Microbacter margulisiae TaxID=1350067 RepID=A0A7W5DND8_9PORP|nr:polysaccharide biosynthesis/export family protein [Microbacter margulisiae]MBB3185956.1 polysaccharide export outer membrane protein [Microbacter margulisiae]
MGCLLLITLLLTSCNAEKKIVYAQKSGSYPNLNDTTVIVPSQKIKIGDLLIITVNTPTPELSIPFNLPLVPTPASNMVNTTSATTAVALQTYLVDLDGNITFPVIGKIHAEGMTKMELESTLKSDIYPHYMKEIPIINVRYANYRISVLGEVAHPGVFTVNNEQISVFEALAMAGDMTIFGKRNNVLLIRQDSNGKRETYRLNLTDKNIIKSPYFFLQQDDILYVQPNKPKARSSAFSTAETISISIVGTLISLASLVVTLAKH